MSEMEVPVAVEGKIKERVSGSKRLWPKLSSSCGDRCD